MALGMGINRLGHPRLVHSRWESEEERRSVCFWSQ